MRGRAALGRPVRAAWFRKVRDWESLCRRFRSGNGTSKRKQSLKLCVGNRIAAKMAHESLLPSGVFYGYKSDETVFRHRRSAPSLASL